MPAGLYSLDVIKSTKQQPDPDRAEAVNQGNGLDVGASLRSGSQENQRQVGDRSEHMMYKRKRRVFMLSQRAKRVWLLMRLFTDRNIRLRIIINENK